MTKASKTRKKPAPATESADTFNDRLQTLCSEFMTRLIEITGRPDTEWSVQLWLDGSMVCSGNIPPSEMMDRIVRVRVLRMFDVMEVGDGHAILNTRRDPKTLN